MMEISEENKNNPTIAKAIKVNCPHYFIIKYKSEAQRIKFSDILMHFVKKYELKDFHIEEKKAFLETKVFYNYHTLVDENMHSIENIEERFLEHFHP